MRVKATGYNNNHLSNSTTSMLNRFVFALIFSGMFMAGSAQITTKTMMPDVNLPLLDSLIATAKRYYPRTHAYEGRVAAQVSNLNKMKLGWYDVFTFSFLYSPNNSTTLVNPSILNGYQLGVYFNIGGLLKNRPMIKQAKAELKVAEYERDEYYLNLAALVRQRYFTYLQQVAILKVRLEAESEAESNMEFFKQRYQKGEVTLDDYNKTLVNMADRVQSKIESEGSVLMAKAAIEELTGKKLEDFK